MVQVIISLENFYRYVRVRSKHARELRYFIVVREPCWGSKHRRRVTRKKLFENLDIISTCLESVVYSFKTYIRSGEKMHEIGLKVKFYVIQE